MRPTIFLFFITSFFFNLNLASQEKYGEYAVYLEDGKLVDGPYDLKISREHQLLYVFMRPSGKGLQGDKGGVKLNIKKRQHQAFISTLQTAKQKFVEWDSVAKENNVEDFQKKMDIRLSGIEAFFMYGSSWHFRFNS